MKKFFILGLTAFLFFFNCTISNVKNSNGSPSSRSHSAGDQIVYSVNGINFTMIYLPGKTFKTGVDDSNNVTVNNSYWIAQTELTYQLWEGAYTWALSNGYTFANAGVMGNDGSKTNQHPVTTINWRDAMIWCNALTEWYNALKGTNLTTAYKSSGITIRDSRSTNATACDNVTADPNATGFRLLTNDEWELAARYISDTNGDGNITGIGEYYPGNHASGDITGYCYDNGIGGILSVNFGNYAWYNANSGAGTHPVKTALPNALGIYDMSGNVWEWSFTLDSSNRIIKGGSWAHSEQGLQIGYTGASFSPDTTHNSIGFRIGIK